MTLRLVRICCAAAILAAAPLSASAAPNIRAYGKNVIAITFIGNFSTNYGMRTTYYTVTAPDSSAIAVSAIGRDSKINEYIEQGWPYTPIMQHTVFLTLSQPMTPGVQYTVVTNRRVTGTSQTLYVTLSDTAAATDLIKVNQCGYLPTGRKLAYLGAYLGSQGSLDLSHLTGQFHLVSVQTQQRVYTGQATLSQAQDSASGENVYWLDFTSFQTPGTYVLEVEGIGRSHSFRIGADVFSAPLATLGQGLYHQRCGIALQAPYTSWPHAACHRGLAKMVTIHDSMDDIMSQLPNYVDPSGKTIDGWGGWHDAGDYDRLGSRHRQVVCDLLDAFEANPDRFSDGQFNIPESGNGIPDVLDEAKWGLDWFERVYDPTDGGFYYRIETANYGFSMPEADNQQLYCMTKYPFYSTWAGVCFAQASRLFRPYDAALADRYLAIARKALQFGQAALQSGDDYSRVRRAVGLLAGEIYVSSGDSSAHNIFLSYGYRDSMGYAGCTRSDVNASARQACRNYFIDAAQVVLNSQHASGYVSCVTGSGGDQAMFDAATLARGYRFSGRTDFFEAARLSLDHHLGANPLGYVWITGVGSVYPKRVLQHPSVYDGIDEPVPGIPIFGPRSVTPSSSTHGGLFAERLYPSYTEYPYLRSYSELPAVVGFSEFTIYSQSAGIVAYSLFAPERSQAPAGQVAGCHVFYNNSLFDGKNEAANVQDADAIAPDKSPLRSGGTATFANYTSYAAGINGVMVDLADAPGPVALSDFSFRAGNSNTPAGWEAAPVPSMTVSPGAGVNGADRYTFIWPDESIENQWLQITVKATAGTGLAADEVFYYGNAIGEVGNSATSAQVNTSDELATRQNPCKTFLNPAGLTNPCDFNRDGRVTTADEIIVRQNVTTFATELKLITVP